MTDDYYTAEQYRERFIFWCPICQVQTDPSDITGCCLFCGEKLKPPVRYERKAS